MVNRRRKKAPAAATLPESASTACLNSVPHGTSFILIGGKKSDGKESDRAYKYVPERRSGTTGGRWVTVPFGLLERGTSGASVFAIGRDEFPDPAY